MQIWELIRRLLRATGPGHTFSSSLVASKYRRDLEVLGHTDLASASEFSEWSQAVSEDLEVAGLIKPAAQKSGASAALLGAMVLTELGDELSQALEGHNVVLLFESMMVDIEPGAIRQVLHQLNS